MAYTFYGMHAFPESLTPVRHDGDADTHTHACTNADIPKTHHFSVISSKGLMQVITWRKATVTGGRTFQLSVPFTVSF